MCLCLGQAKLIASFLFQHFQNIMWAEGHYSLWPNLEENTKINNNENIGKYLKIHAVEIAIIMKILWHFYKSMQAETGN